MMNSIFLLLVLLQIKHWYIDFVNQSPEEVAGKGIYGNPAGLMHSIKQGVATFIILLFFVDEPMVAIILAVGDFVLHYHIDYCKMHYGNRDIKTPAFWAQLGLDQMAHQLTYIGIAALLLI